MRLSFSIRATQRVGSHIAKQREGVARMKVDHARNARDRAQSGGGLPQLRVCPSCVAMTFPFLYSPGVDLIWAPRFGDVMALTGSVRSLARCSRRDAGPRGYWF